MALETQISCNQQSSPHLSLLDYIFTVFRLIGDLTAAWLYTIIDIFATKRKSVQGQVVVITGGAGAIGKSLGQSFVKLGAKVALLDLNEKAVVDAASEIRDNSVGSAFGFVCDCTDLESMKKIAEKIRRHSELGEVDIVCCCAGVLVSKSVLEHTVKDIKLTIDVNVLGNFWTIQAFMPAMLERNSGHIVSISSAAGHFGNSFSSAYSASKFAIRGLMESLQWELQDLGKTGVHTTTVYPYFTQTPLLKSCNPSSRFFDNLPIEYTVQNIMDAILYERKEFYIPNFMQLVCVYLKMTSPFRVKAVWRKFFNVSYMTSGEATPSIPNAIGK